MATTSKSKVTVKKDGGTFTFIINDVGSIMSAMSLTGTLPMGTPQQRLDMLDGATKLGIYLRESGLTSIEIEREA